MQDRCLGLYYRLSVLTCGEWIAAHATSLLLIAFWAGSKLYGEATMKSSLFILMLFLFSSCCSKGNEPKPDFGTPNDITRFSGSSGYTSITYTYYCHNGQYIAIDYVSDNHCSKYRRTSVFRTSGICSGIAKHNHTQARIDSILLEIESNSKGILNP